MYRLFAFLLRLPGGKAQIILALLLLGADPLKNAKRDYLIVLLQRHAPNPCRGAALEFAHISGGEANGLALPCGEQHVVALSPQFDPDQAIGCALIKAHCDLAVCGYISEGIHTVPSHASKGGCKHDMEVLPLFLIFNRRQHRLDDFTIGQRQQVDHWPPARGRTAFRQAPHFHALHLAVIGEEQNGRVRAGDEQSAVVVLSSEERRVGRECGSPCGYWWTRGN